MNISDSLSIFQTGHPFCFRLHVKGGYDHFPTEFVKSLDHQTIRKLILGSLQGAKEARAGRSWQVV